MNNSSLLGKVTQAVLALGGALLVTVLVLQVALRYIFHAPLFGIEELARTIAMWLYFIASAYALVVGGHICSDVRDLFKLSAKSTRITDILITAMTVAGSALIAWYASHYAWWVYQSGELTPGLWWPRYILVAASAFGGCAMTVVSLMQLLRQLSGQQLHQEAH